ncbi:unnamed protein product [Rhizophagus irregularis]|nr:unnamed protein product [Rhizophagus irregularis]
MLITTCSWESMILRLFGRAGDDLIEYRKLRPNDVSPEEKDFDGQENLNINGLLDAWNSVYFKSQNVGNSFFHSRRENGRVE